jgi:hypothetical protein
MSSSFGTRFVERLLMASMIAASISLAARAAYACTFSPRMPWFSENVNLANAIRPSGILFKHAGHTVSVTNNLDASSFYINGYNGLKEMGKSVEFSSNNYNGLLANGYYVKSLDPRNTDQGDRPADVKVPEPQDTVVEILLDQKTYSFQLRISYELNKDYMPVTLLASDSSCEGSFPFDLGLDPMFFYSLLPIIIVAVLFLVLHIIIKQNKKTVK